jgi:glycosyltransferase involved in cell wall biosynthesis
MHSQTVIISVNSSWNLVNFRSGLIAGLRRGGYDVVALSPLDGSTEALADLGAKHIPITMDQRGTSPVRDLRLLASYLHQLRRFRSAVFLGYTAKPNIYGSLAAHALGIPVINNVAGLGVTFIERNWLNRLVRVMYRAALRGSHRVFFQNPDDRALFVSDGIIDPAKTAVLPGSGIDLKRFAPRPKEGAEGEFVFLLVARLLVAKGIRDFVEAARQLKSIFPTARWQIAGLSEGKRKDAISASELREWQSEGVVEYLGPLADVRPAIAAADVVVLPSYYPEGTPRSLLEGAAMGKPLITCDVPGCRAVVKDGVNGYFCLPKNPSSLALAMRSLAELPRHQLKAMGRASRELVEEHYDEQIVVQRYLEEIAAAFALNQRPDVEPARRSNARSSSQSTSARP